MAFDLRLVKFTRGTLFASGVRKDAEANDEMLLMRLELEVSPVLLPPQVSMGPIYYQIKDARVRLANAELEVAKSVGKVEAARQKVIEQRLKIERARTSHIGTRAV